MENFNYLRLLLILTVAIYFVFDYFDEKIMRDEREELIRLKTFELVHKVTTGTLCVLAIVSIFLPPFETIYPLFALTLAFLYTEIVGKIYFRRKF